MGTPLNGYDLFIYFGNKSVIVTVCAQPMVEPFSKAKPVFCACFIFHCPGLPSFSMVCRAVTFVPARK